ncbi:MAG: hypothetical protein HC921_21695 [Synechococcaceae cyanobacterium SM2_3_1]|nr:hypothetical protein [Synechococcaceae cyanobacterium SM2_3_1]
MRPTTLWIPIGSVLLLSACGGDGSPVALSTDSMDPSAPTTSLLIEVPLPGFVPRQVNLIEQEIFSTQIPILSPNYAVTWTGSFTDGRILAQSRSNLPSPWIPVPFLLDPRPSQPVPTIRSILGFSSPWRRRMSTSPSTPAVIQVSLDFTLTPQSKIPLPPEPPPPPPRPGL